MDGQVGAALGLAIFSALATSRTNSLLAAHAAPDVAATSGFRQALVADVTQDAAGPQRIEPGVPGHGAAS